IKVDLLPLSRDDAHTNLLWRLFLLDHLVAVVELFHANGTVAAVLTLKATVQALVAMAPVAVAITRLLIDHLRNLGRQFVGVHLHELVLGLGIGQLARGQDRRNAFALSVSLLVISRDIGWTPEPLGRAGNNRSQCNAEHGDQSFHSGLWVGAAGYFTPFRPQIRLIGAGFSAAEADC